MGLCDQLGELRAFLLRTKSLARVMEEFADYLVRYPDIIRRSKPIAADDPFLQPFRDLVTEFAGQFFEGNVVDTLRLLRLEECGFVHGDFSAEGDFDGRRLTEPGTLFYFEEGGVGAISLDWSPTSKTKYGRLGSPPPAADPPTPSRSRRNRLQAQAEKLQGTIDAKAQELAEMKARAKDLRAELARAKKAERDLGQA